MPDRRCRRAIGSGANGRPRLRRDQIAQRVARLLVGAERQQRAGGLDQIARPHQMVAAALVAAVAPRDAEARHHRARIGLVEMAAQHDRRDQKLFGKRRRHVERHGVALAAFGLPRLPWRDVLLQEVVERLQQAGDRQGRRRLGAAAKTERQHGAARQFGDRARHCPGRRAGIPRSSADCGRNPASRR